MHRPPAPAMSLPAAPVTSAPVTAGAPGAPPETATHWLLPIDPAAHAEHQPDDWRQRHDATAVWGAIGRSQPIDRWCLRSGFRTLRRGDLIWAYLSRRQELCAVGAVRSIDQEAGRWFVHIDWDEARTAQLGRDPVPRSAFGQVPMSTCRAGDRAAAVLTERYEELGTSGRP